MRCDVCGGEDRPLTAREAYRLLRFDRSKDGPLRHGLPFELRRKLAGVAVMSIMRFEKRRMEVLTRRGVKFGEGTILYEAVLAEETALCSYGCVKRWARDRADLHLSAIYSKELKRKLRKAKV